MMEQVAGVVVVMMMVTGSQGSGGGGGHHRLVVVGVGDVAVHCGVVGVDQGRCSGRRRRQYTAVMLAVVVMVIPL